MSKFIKVNNKSDNFRPGPDAILVKVEYVTHEVSDGGIFIPIKWESVIDRPTHGIVVRIGTDVDNIAVGEEVHFPEDRGVDFEMDDGIYTCIKADSILCVVEHEL